MKQIRYIGKLSFFHSIILLTFLLITNLEICAQACTLCSQADVDNYVIGGDPDLGLHVGDLNISGPDITNLDNLYGIKNVFIGSLRIYGNPLLENVDGLGSLEQATYDVVIENNALLENLDSLDGLYGAGSLSIENNSELSSIVNNSLIPNYLGRIYIIDNASLKDIQMIGAVGNLSVLEINNNPSLTNIDLSGVTNTIGNITISNNPALKNLDGFSNVPEVSQLTAANNTSLSKYCGLNAIIFNDINAPITLSGNLTNPSNAEILYIGSCGIFVRNAVGYPTLAAALSGAEDHSFIYVTRDKAIDVSTTFSGHQKHTLVIQPNVKLSFIASFTNEGIVINHGTLEMLNGAVLTNIGPMVNTGTVIAN